MCRLYGFHSIVQALSGRFWLEFGESFRLAAQTITTQVVQEPAGQHECECQVYQEKGIIDHAVGEHIHA